MYRCEFKKALCIFGEMREALIKVRHDGWAEVYDSEGLYCGSINPYKTMMLCKGGQI